jgi:nucleoside-diphosphate-sugar epimerase
LLVGRGYEFAVSSRQVIGQGKECVHWHQANLIDLSEVQVLLNKVRPTHLLHFAWYTVPGKYWTSVENLYWVQASISLLKEFMQYGGQRVVMAGSCAEYDWRHGYCSEAKTPLAPTTLYGICKHSLELLLSAFSKQVGLSSAWGRIFFPFGPHEHPDRLVAYVIQSLLRKEPALCSHGRQIRDFLYVQDVADAFVRLLESGVSGPVNIASGQKVALRKLIYNIAAKIKREDLVQLDSLSVPEDEPPLLVADVQRLHDEVGWTPKYDLDHGLEQTMSGGHETNK